MSTKDQDGRVKVVVDHMAGGDKNAEPGPAIRNQSGSFGKMNRSSSSTDYTAISVSRGEIAKALKFLNEGSKFLEIW